MTWKRALEADARLAAKNSVLVRAALRQQIDAQAAYYGYLATTPDTTLSLPQQRARARAWAIINIRPNLEPLKAVVEKMWSDGIALGYTAAGEAILEAQEAKKADTKALIDWSKWKPGDASAAAKAKTPGLLSLLQRAQGFTWKGFSDTTLNDLGNSIGEAIELGLDAKTSAKNILNHVASPSRALSIAITEQNRAISYATSVRYRESGLEQMQWLVFDPCKICAQNENAVVNIGQFFPSGDQRPPAHPNCRCALAPVIPGFEEAPLPGATVVTPPAPVVPEVVPVIPVAPVPSMVSTQFVPGQWRELTREEIREEFIQDTLKRYPTMKREGVENAIALGNLTPADLALVKTGIILRNGPIRSIFIDSGLDLNKKERDGLLKKIEDLQIKQPKEEMSIVVTRTGKKRAYGSAILGDAKIFIKPDVAKDLNPLPKEKGFKMPSIAVAPHRDYTLTHEWGHSIDVGGRFGRTTSIQNAATMSKIKKLKKQYADVPEAFVSEYAQTNTKEFYAEMYAEWMLSEGKTINPLVKAMAQEFNWHKFAMPTNAIIDDALTPPPLFSNVSESVERNKLIKDDIEEYKTLLGKNASDERVLNAITANGTQGEIDNTTIYMALKKKYENMGFGADAKYQVQGTLLRVEYYLRNKKIIDEMQQELDKLKALGKTEDIDLYNKNAEYAKKRALSAMKDGKVTIAVTQPTLRGIFKDGRFKSQFESGKSGGLYDPYIRKIRENATFGLNVNIPNEQRPIYGFISDNVKGTRGFPTTTEAKWTNRLSVFTTNVEQYGDIRIVLKDTVKARTTATIGDSLGRGMLADNITGTTPDLANMGMIREGAPLNYLGEPQFSYFEAQVQGGVKLADIDTIYVDLPADSQFYLDTKKMIEESGLDIKLVRRDELK